MRTSTIVSPLILSAFVSMALARSNEGPRRLQRRTFDYGSQGSDNYGMPSTGPGPEVYQGGKGSTSGTGSGSGSGSGGSSTTTPSTKSGSKTDAESQDGGKTTTPPSKSDDDSKTTSSTPPSKTEDDGKTKTPPTKTGDDGMQDGGKGGDDDKGDHKEDGEDVKPPKKCKAKSQGGSGGSGSGSTTTPGGSGSKTSSSAGGHFTVGEVKCHESNSHCVFMHDKCYTTGADAVQGVYPPVMCSKQDDAGNGVGKCVFPDNTSTTVACPGKESIHLSFSADHSWYEETSWHGYAIWSSEKNTAGFVDTPSKETNKKGADCYVWADKPKDTSKWSSGGSKSGDDNTKPPKKSDEYGQPKIVEDQPKDTGSQMSPPQKEKSTTTTTTTPPKKTKEEKPEGKPEEKSGDKIDAETPGAKGKGSSSGSGSDSGSGNGDDGKGKQGSTDKSGDLYGSGEGKDDGAASKTDAEKQKKQPKSDDGDNYADGGPQ